MLSCFSFPRAQRKENFHLENGGRVLEKLITCFDGKYNPFRMFTKEELDKATNNYHMDGILHKQFNYVLYRGTHDDRDISVKKFVATSSDQIIKEWCINEIAVVSQMSKHNNIIKFFGCCLETEIPTLVFEFAGNGNLSELIFDDHRLQSWESRLRIVTEAAHAVAYLQNGTSKPIVHRDITSTNIFLDQNYAAKLFEFGFSVQIPLGEKHVDAEVVGSVEFIAPESHKTGRYSEKSDVYSFGAVLLEIITGKRARNILQNEFEVPEWNSTGRGSSILRAQSSCNWNEMERNTESYLKANVLDEGNRNQLMECAELALRCLKMNPDERPIMKEVAQSLRVIRKTPRDTSI